jgi:hypothetical protein
LLDLRQWGWKLAFTSLGFRSAVLALVVLGCTPDEESFGERSEAIGGTGMNGTLNGALAVGVASPAAAGLDDGLNAALAAAGNGPLADALQQAIREGLTGNFSGQLVLPPPFSLTPVNVTFGPHSKAGLANLLPFEVDSWQNVKAWQAPPTIDALTSCQVVAHHGIKVAGNIPPGLPVTGLALISQTSGGVTQRVQMVDRTSGQTYDVLVATTLLCGHRMPTLLLSPAKSIPVSGVIAAYDSTIAGACDYLSLPRNQAWRCSLARVGAGVPFERLSMQLMIQSAPFRIGLAQSVTDTNGLVFASHLAFGPYGLMALSEPRESDFIGPTGWGFNPETTSWQRYVGSLGLKTTTGEDGVAVADYDYNRSGPPVSGRANDCTTGFSLTVVLASPGTVSGYDIDLSASSAWKQRCKYMFGARIGDIVTRARLVEGVSCRSVDLALTPAAAGLNLSDGDADISREFCPFY